MSAYSWIRTGTVTCTHGSTIVVGFGTNWTTLPVQAGDEFTQDNVMSYEVVNVIDDTHLSIDRGFEGDTLTGTYAIRHNFSPLGQSLLTSVQQTLNIFRTLMGGVPVQFVEGTPSAPALDGAFAVNELNDTLFVQRAGAWVSVGGGGGGGSSAGNTVTPLGTLGATAVVDVTTHRIFTGTLGQPATAILPTIPGGSANTFVAVLMRLVQDTTGSRALAAQTGVTWAGSGYVPGLNPAPGSIADIEFTSFDGGATWVAAIVNQTAGS